MKEPNKTRGVRRIVALNHDLRPVKKQGLWVVRGGSRARKLKDGTIALGLIYLDEVQEAK